MTQLVMTFHTDPGHGWLEVNRGLMDALEVTPSGYSYQDAVNVYLEEDCDAALLIDALKRRGISYKVKEMYADPCFVRGLRHYRKED